VVVDPSTLPRKKISIEKLLVWAYRDQMVHAARPEAEPIELLRNNYSPGWAGSSPHVDVAVDSGGMKLAFSAHHDAYAVDRSVGALGTTRRERTREEVSIMMARRAMKEVALIAERRATGGSTMVFSDELVEVVHRSALVRMYAIRGRRPETIDEPVYMYERDGCVKDPKKHRSVLCKIRWVGDDPREVEQARARYELWRQCLCDLRVALVGQVAAHALTDELPPPAPTVSQ